MTKSNRTVGNAPGSTKQSRVVISNLANIALLLLLLFLLLLLLLLLWLQGRASIIFGICPEWDTHWLHLLLLILVEGLKKISTISKPNRTSIIISLPLTCLSYWGKRQRKTKKATKNYIERREYSQKVYALHTNFSIYFLWNSIFPSSFHMKLW